MKVVVLSRKQTGGEGVYNLSGAKLIQTLGEHPGFKTIIHRFGVHTCYLFGSRITGQIGPHSDIDFAVLFADFDPSRHHLDYIISLENELSNLLAPTRVDVIGLQAISDIALRFEIISTSEVIYCSDNNARTDFEEVVIRDYQDFKPVLDKYYEEMEEEVFGP